MTHERPRLNPKIGRSRFNKGPFSDYEIEFERISHTGDRSSSLVISELSLVDLEVLEEALSHYLDEGRYQEVQ